LSPLSRTASPRGRLGSRAAAGGPPAIRGGWHVRLPLCFWHPYRGGRTCGPGAVRPTRVSLYPARAPSHVGRLRQHRAHGTWVHGTGVPATPGGSYGFAAAASAPGACAALRLQHAGPSHCCDRRVLLQQHGSQRRHCGRARNTADGGQQDGPRTTHRAPQHRSPASGHLGSTLSTGLGTRGSVARGLPYGLCSAAPGP
jgi:hypothetical protein